MRSIRGIISHLGVWSGRGPGSSGRLLTRLGVLSLGLTALLLLEGCYNGPRRTRSLGGASRSYLLAGNEILLQVVRSNTNPDRELNLIGKADGSLTRDCRPAVNGPNFGNPVGGMDNQDTGTGPSTCKCVFRYSTFRADNVEEFRDLESDTLYRETALLRCPIPPEIRSLSLRSFSVSVRYAANAAGARSGSTQATAQDTFSNEVVFNAGTGIGDAANPLSAETFVQVKRFQCTDILTHTSTYWADVYDREISEDPRATTPLNFYATNLGQSLALASQGFSSGTGPKRGLPGWECPANPMDAGVQYSSNPVYNRELIKVAFGSAPGTPYAPDFKRAINQPLLTKYDMRIFSQQNPPSTSATLGNLGTSMIFPLVPGSTNKTDFFVAKRPSGIFQIPVNAVVAPGVNTDPQGKVGPLPLGYAALSRTRGQEEYCPDNTAMYGGEAITIPQGYKFAKLWLFRSALANRALPQFEPNAVSASGDIIVDGALACLNSRSGDFGPDASRRTLIRAGRESYRGDWILGSSLNPLQMTETNQAPRFDYLFIVSPTEVQTQDIYEGTAKGKPFIPVRALSALDCREGGPCQQGRLLPPYYLMGNDIGAASASFDPDPSLAQLAGSDTFETYRKFPLCVLVKEEGAAAGEI